MKMMMKGKNGEETLGEDFSSDFTYGTASSENRILGANKSSKTSSPLRFHNTNSVLFYAVALVLLLFAFSFDMQAVSAMPRCTPCPGGECPDPPHECPHGIVTNYCGRKICAKGPGELCGTGMFKMLGTCGDGMYCHCGRCSGCSLSTMMCFDTVCMSN